MVMNKFIQVLRISGVAGTTRASLCLPFNYRETGGFAAGYDVKSRQVGTIGTI